MQDATGEIRRQSRRAIPFALLALLVVGSGLAVWTSAGSTAASRIGPEGVAVRNVPDLAPATSTLTGRTVDGITCQTQAKEVVKYHIHSYVSFYVNGREQRLPAGIGITQPPLIEHYSTGDVYDVGLYDCLYWIHTHTNDGIVHIEAPVKTTFTLGQLFGVWNQPLNSTQVGSAKGAVVVFENGKRASGDPRMVPILPHSVIQIDVGSPATAFRPFTYKVTGGCGQGTTSCSTK
jgi:hypothetical protein